MMSAKGRRKFHGKGPGRELGQEDTEERGEDEGRNRNVCDRKYGGDKIKL